MEAKNLKDAFNIAIELEEKGHQYYKGIAQKADNPLTKQLFTTLAEQELEHINRIEEFYNKSPDIALEKAISRDELEKAVKDVFNKFSKEDKGKWETHISEAYEHAIVLEQDSAKMYSDFAEKTEDDAERKFFEALAGEEDSHFNALQNVYNYLKHTGDWFESTESERWNWMNT